MNRILVKNLDKKLSKDKISDYFKTVGEIENLELKKDDLGRFIGECWIEYIDNDSAVDAVIFFDGQILDFKEISVRFDVSPVQEITEIIVKIT